ncbi:hypothetical protein FRC03_002550 [Tulasnella sp. 419]|nr:hypothetical protein FRC03_002550 [Tulasnella sp. 419]
MSSWGRLNPLNLLRASAIDRTNDHRNDAEHAQKEENLTNVISSIIDPNPSLSALRPQSPFHDSNNGHSTFQTLPAKSSIRSFFKRNRTPREDANNSHEESSTWNSPPHLRKSASFHHSKSAMSIDDTQHKHSGSVDQSPAHRSTGSARYPRTPLHTKVSYGSVRSILRDHNTPGTGSKVRFFSQGLPKSSADNSMSTDGLGSENHSFNHPQEEEENDSTSFLSRLQEASLEEAEPSNLSPKMSPLRSRRGLSPDFFTPPTRSSIAASRALRRVDGSTSNLSGASDASNPFNMSHEIQSIPVAEDGSVILGSTSLEMPEDSGDPEPSYLLPETSERIGPMSLTEAGQQFLSMETSTSNSASSLRRSRDLGASMNTSQKDGTIYHSIAVTSPMANGTPLSPADTSSGILNEGTSEQHDYSFSDASLSATQDGSSQNPFPRPHPSSRRRSSSISQEIALLRQQLSIQQNISVQFEADLSARDELVELLTEKVDSFSRQALRYKQEAERRDEKLRKTKQKLIDLKKSCDALSDEIDRSRGEKLERSLFDEATGEALRVLQSKIKTLESEKRELEMKNLDFESRVDKKELDAALEDRSRLEEEVKLLRDNETKLEAEISQFKDNTIADDWREERKQLLQEKVEADDKIALLEMEKAALMKTSDDLHKAVTLKDKELHVLQREVEAQWANTERSEDALKELRSQMKELSQTARRLAEEKEKMERELQGRGEQIQQMKNVISDLQATNETLEANAQKRNDLSSDSRDLIVELEALEAEMEVIRNERDGLKDEVTKQKRRSDAGEVERLRRTVEDLTVSREELEQELYLVQEELQEERHARKTEAGRASPKGAQNVNSESLKKLQDLLKDRDYELTDTNARLAAYETEIEDLKQEIKEVSRDHHQQLDNQAHQTEQLRKQEADLRKELDKLAASKAKFEATIAGLETQVKAAREENLVMNSRIKDLRKDNAKKEMQLVQLERGRELDREDKEGLNIALDAKQQELEMIKRKLGLRGTAGSTPAPSRIRESLGFGTGTMSEIPAFGASDSKHMDEDSATESAPETYPLRTSAVVNGGIKPTSSHPAVLSKRVRIGVDGSILPSIRARPRSSLASLATPTPAAPLGQGHPLMGPSNDDRRRSKIEPAAALPIHRRVSADLDKTPTANNLRKAGGPTHGLDESVEGSSDEKENREPRSLLSASVGNSSAIRSKNAAPVPRKTSSSKDPAPLLA